MNNRVKIIICGKTYTLQTEESPSYVIHLSKELDKRINHYMDDNASASVTSAAILVALELMDENAKAIEDVNNIRAQIKGYVEENAAACNEADRLRRELAMLKKENENLKKDLNRQDAGHE